MKDRPSIKDRHALAGMRFAPGAQPPHRGITGLAGQLAGNLA